MANQHSIRTEAIYRTIPHGKRAIVLRMAPMIDIIFLLLIFFLVAGKWQPQQGQLPFKLPAAGGSTMQIGKTEPLVIKLTSRENACTAGFADQRIRLQQEQMGESLTAMLEKLKTTLEKQNRTTGDPVEIVCGDGVEWDYFAKVYNLLYGAGITEITFTVTEAEAGNDSSGKVDTE